MIAVHVLTFLKAVVVTWYHTDVATEVTICSQNPFPIVRKDTHWLCANWQFANKHVGISQL